jgi:hypothetical protein
MGRKEDLEQNIRESYELMGEYEGILRLSSDPKEKARAQRAIDEQRELIQGWAEEYLRLGGSALSDHITGIASFPSKAGTVASPASGRPSVEPQRPVPWLSYFFLALVVLDLALLGVLGWRFLGDQPALLSYLEVVIGVLGLGSGILLAVIVIQRKMSIADVLYWLGTSRLWEGVIIVVTITLVLGNAALIVLPYKPSPTPAMTLQIKLDDRVIQDEQTLIRDRDFVWIEAEVLNDGTPVPFGAFEYKWSFNPPDNQNQDKDWSEVPKVDYHLPHDLQYQLLTVQVRGEGHQWSRSIHFTIKE